MKNVKVLRILWFHWSISVFPVMKVLKT